MTRPYFGGYGIHTHLGRGLAANVAALKREPPPPTLIEVKLGRNSETIPYQLLADAPLEDLPSRFYRHLDAVVADAIASAALTAEDLHRTALFVGTSSLDIGVSEAVFQRQIAASPDAHALMVNIPMGNVAQHVRERFLVGGPDYTFNTACTSSANALLYANQMICAGRFQTALVLGVEMFNLITALGFQGLELLAPGGMKPFDAKRAGLVPGESCAALVLTARPGRANMGFAVRGGANLCDTYSISAANPDGSTVAATISNALEAAGAVAGDIAAIKAHGTASLLNDEAEANGILKIFARAPPLTALKPFIGHTFGACGLTEALLFSGAALEGFLPGLPGIGSLSGELGVALNQHASPLAPGMFLLNYFGFGGNNTALVIANA